MDTSRSHDRGPWLPGALGTAALVILGPMAVACGDEADAVPVIDPGDGGNYAPAIGTRMTSAAVPSAPGSHGPR